MLNWLSKGAKTIQWRKKIFLTNGPKAIGYLYIKNKTKQNNLDPHFIPYMRITQNDHRPKCKT